jgi:hypothetical protein
MDADLETWLLIVATLGSGRFAVSHPRICLEPITAGSPGGSMMPSSAHRIAILFTSVSRIVGLIKCLDIGNICVRN